MTHEMINSNPRSSSFMSSVMKHGMGILTRIRPSLSTLIFHRVLPVPDPMRPYEIDARTFTEQMTWVRDSFNVLPLNDAVELMKNGRLPPRALSITFDDGYQDNLTVAIPILNKLGLHATFFLTTGFMDGSMMFNDRLIETLRLWPEDRFCLPDYAIDLPIRSVEERRAAIPVVLDKFKYLSYDEREEQSSLLLKKLPGKTLPRIMLDETETRQLADTGMGIGGHTRSHPILARLSNEQAEQEIATNLSDLKTISGRSVDLFAYPNGKPGKDFNDDNRDTVKRLGFNAAFTTSKGVGNQASDPYQIPRFTPWDQTAFRYIARLSLNALN